MNELLRQFGPVVFPTIANETIQRLMNDVEQSFKQPIKQENRDFRGVFKIKKRHKTVDFLVWFYFNKNIYKHNECHSE
jgi:hypothetical protein